MKNFLRALFLKLGLEVRRTGAVAFDMYSDKEFMAVFERCKPFTMTSVERMYSLYQAIRYVIQRGIPGDIVECGVWRGGSTMLCCEVMRAMGEVSRGVYLYDTYTGMAEPSDVDVDAQGNPAKAVWKRRNRGDHNEWVYASLDEVRANLLGTGYPESKLHFVKGKVEETIPLVAPEQIALLRLDTDFHASTLHELMHLYPRIAPSGILILDDYGAWKGARPAVDQYFSEHGPVLLNRIDSGGRLVFRA